MKPGKQEHADNLTALQHIFGSLDMDTDVVVQSCLCSEALLNENTGIYGCRLMSCECPYETPDPKRCLASGRFPRNCKLKIIVPKIVNR